MLPHFPRRAARPVASLLGAPRPVALLLAAALLLIQARPAAADLAEAQAAFYRGDYAECIEQCSEQIERRVWNSQWTQLQLECFLRTGRYSEALAAYEEALDRFGDDIRLRLIGRDVYRMNDRAGEGEKQLEQITSLIQRMPWRYSGGDDLVPLGRLMLLQGEDARQVLQVCFDKAAAVDPDNAEPRQAIAELALEKGDFAEAAASADAARKLRPTDPHLAYLSARAWDESDSEQASAALAEALRLNPRHVPSILMVAEQKIDGEDYDAAEALLEEAAAVNPAEPQLWALRAVIAHLRGNYEAEGEHRRKALQPWRLNPQVDYVIGTKLSRHYRFDEAIVALRRALQMAPSDHKVAFALAQDLLRTGRTEEGWAILAAVRAADEYNVVAFNLSQLKERLDAYATIEAPGLVLRMDAREAKIYGQAAVELLSEARRVLTEKYKAELEEPVYVEIFDRQQDFAIRTFGLPGGEGYLGVCFGRLITANSPRSAGVGPQNWKAVLWHEYCHVVTLQKSNNRMPRWLSEGISVYEERLRDPSWGQPLDRQYREMLLSEDFVPISELSGAFLRPKSGMHLQFAYFESSLAVQFLVERYGFEALLRVLDDLGLGLPVNDALERLTGSLAALDAEFLAYAREAAEAYAPGADWSVDDEELKAALKPDGTGLAGLLEKHPDSPGVLRLAAQQKIAQEKHADALPLLERLRRFEPDDAESDGLYAMLAACHRAMGNTDAEYAALGRLAEIGGNPVDALARLIEVDSARGDWDKVAAWASKYLAISPLQPLPHRAVVDAAEATERLPDAAHSLRALLNLEPIDPAELHLQLAKATAQSDAAEAKRQVLQALEIAPRYRAAYEVLRELP